MATKDRTREPPRSTSKKTYTPPSLLDIPEDVRERFLNESYALRWIRVQIKHNADYKQISKRKREGYTFVKAEEVEDLMGHLGLISDATGMVRSGDLALAKVHLEDQKARQDYYEDMARRQEQAFMKDLEKQNNRTMPIHNDSRSVTRTGRAAEFAKD